MKRRDSTRAARRLSTSAMPTPTGMGDPDGIGGTSGAVARADERPVNRTTSEVAGTHWSGRARPGSPTGRAEKPGLR